MLLDLRKMRGTHDHVDRAIDPSRFEVADEVLRVVAPVRLTFDIDRDGTAYHLVGRTASELELTCSRCLEGFRWPIEAAFDLLYLPDSANAGEGELEVQDEDLNTAFYRDETIDLGQLVREQFYLAVPMKPLCAEACKGLCATCGANLNTGSCGCQRTWEDPRLGGLKDLVKDRGQTE